MIPSLSSCPHKTICSGCSSIESFEQLVQRATLFFSEMGIAGYEVVRGEEIGWRTRVKLAVRRQGHTALVCGLFRQGSHDVVSIPNCLAHHPKINEALLHLAKLSPHLGYEERSMTGQLRYVQAVVERKSQKVQLSFVLALSDLTSQAVLEWEKKAHELFAHDPTLWHSFWINLQPLPSNTIFGPIWKHVTGAQFVWETIAGCEVSFLPSHFCQANLEMFERLLHDLSARLSKNSRVVELFAGMGVISLALRRHCSSVTAIERDASAEDAFMRAKQRLPSQLQDNMRYVVGDAKDCYESVQDATTVVVDPPRKGLSLDLIQTIAESKSVQTLFYISCHFPTLERDVVEMMRQGGFSISFARSYLFFPGTGHIETLVCFTR